MAHLRRIQFFVIGCDFTVAEHDIARVVIAFVAINTRLLNGIVLVLVKSEFQLSLVLSLEIDGGNGAANAVLLGKGSVVPFAAAHALIVHFDSLDLAWLLVQ